MHCAYICCLALYIGTAGAVVNHGEAPQYTIAPAVEQLQQQQSQQQKQQQQQTLHFLNQQSLPGNNNNFAASAAHPIDPATSPHFLSGYSYTAPAAITTIRPPTTALTTTIVPAVTTAPTQVFSPDYIYNAPMPEGYNNHAYYPPYNQPNYQTAALTVRTDAEPSLSFTPNYYVPQSAAANSEVNRQEASNFYAEPQLPNKTEAPQSALSQESSLQQESTSQQVVSANDNDNNNAQQTLTPYQRIFREFADYLLWKRAQAKQQQQIQNSQQMDSSDSQNQYEFIAASAGAAQTDSRPYQVSQSSPLVSLPQTTEAPARNVDTLQRPIGAQRPLISGEDHVAYLSKPSESWELPSLECVKANKQLQAIFNEQRPLSSGLNRGQYDETSYKQHQHAVMEPGTWQGGQQLQEFEWRKQQQLQEQQQQALQHQKLQQLQGVQDQSHQQQPPEKQYQELNLQQQQQYQKQQQNNLQQQQNLQQFQQQEQSIQQQQHQKQQNNLQQQQKYNLQHQQRQQKQQQVQEQQPQLKKVQQLQVVQQELLQQRQKEEKYNLQQQQHQSQQQQPKQQYQYQHPEQHQQEQQQQKQHQQQQQEYKPQQHNHLHQQLQQKLQQTHVYPPADLTQQQTAGLAEEGHAQKPHLPLNAVLHVHKLPQQKQPQQGHPLPQSIYASASEPNQAAQTQAPVIQQAGTAFTPPSLGNQLAQQQQPLLYAHTLKQTVEATTPAAFLQSSQLTRLPTQSAQLNLPTSYNSNAYFNSYARQLRRPHAIYGVPL